MSNKFVDQTQVVRRLRTERSHALRHERNHLDVRPHGTEVFDYSGSLQSVQVGLTTLDEALPAGQSERVREAFLLMRQGVEELAVWLRARGVEV